MSRGVNKAIIIGNLGQDPELRHMPSGGAVTNISVATSESWKDKNTGQDQVRTEWHKIIFFNRLAEIAAQYLKKGSKVYVSGSLRTRKWTDQQGVDKYSTEIVASELQMLDGKQGGGQQGEASRQEPHQGQYYGRTGQPPQQQGSANDYRAASEGGSAGGGDFMDFDDDIPF